MKNYLLIFGVITVSIVLILFALMMFGHFSFTSEAEKNISSIFTHTSSHPKELVDFDYFKNLPPVVRNYLNQTGINKKKPWRSLFLSHDGVSRKLSSSRYKKTYGNLYLRIEPPAFVWFGSIKTSPVSYLKFMETLNNEGGQYYEKLYSLLTMNKSDGDFSSQLSLLRFFAFSPVAPQLLLPNKYLKWIRDDSVSATAEINYNLIKEKITFFFDGKNRISRSYCKFGFINYSGYHLYDGILLPETISMDWKMPVPEFRNVNFNIHNIKWH